MTVSGPPAVGNPFPGLRPFRQDEEHLFFGRETQVDTLIDKLAATRFLAVVGTSGSGKSSLVNCGLVPALHRGLMAGAGGGWRVTMLRPGNRPIKALAEALVQALTPNAVPPALGDDIAFSPAELMEATLRLGRLGLVDAVEQAHLPEGQQLLVVVDQFEELFRYQTLATTGAAAVAGAGEDATAFVNLLLEAGAQRALPVYVVLTMRSDFLGDCAQFFGLPEAINRGQYLVPRLTRDERRLAIAGPLGVASVSIDPVLLTRLLNDVGDNPDQLSILQHALHRTWAHWQHAGGQGALALVHYMAVGAMDKALNQHAEEAWDALAGPRLQAVCALLFKAITDKTSDARGTRRPTRLDRLVSITGASAAELAAVAEVFREPTRSFLMPPAGVVLTDDTPIDIAHESLMRVWARLRDWGDEEALAAQAYRRLAEGAELQAALLRQPDLQRALDWRERQQPSAAWAERYHRGFAAAMDFIDHSQQAHDNEQRAESTRLAEQTQLLEERRLTRRRWLVVVPIVGALCVALVGSLWLLFDASQQRQRAEEQSRLAYEAIQLAKAEAVTAKAALLAADNSAAEARRSSGALLQQRQIYAEATRNAPEVRAKVEQAVQRQSLVYLQFADPAQAAMALRLRVALARAGYSAPGTQKVAAAPSRTELRYFREVDAVEAEKLAALLRRWNWGPFKPRFISGYEASAQLRQFELWLSRPDSEEVTRLLQQAGAPEKNDRLRALQVALERGTAQPVAISGALALLQPPAVDGLSAAGRFNVLYFLSRTAPLAWDPAMEAAGRDTVARLRLRPNLGNDSRDELLRLERLLDAVKAGDAAAPAANLAAG